ncbi:MAG: asparagine synthase-related protein, partial [Nitrososphaerales archaeon]
MLEQKKDIFKFTSKDLVQKKKDSMSLSKKEGFRDLDGGQLLDQLELSVTRRVGTAKRIAIAFSGGIDSSLIAFIAKRHTRVVGIAVGVESSIDQLEAKGYAELIGLGIIGGGQLGMMLTEAAKNLPNEISEVIVLDPTEGCPASRVGAKQIIGDFKDEEAIAELVSKSDILTYEIESGNSDVLKAMESRVKINPSPETLKIIQDKLLQKTFLSENGLPVPDFIEIKSLNGLQQGIEKFGYPALLKTR